MLTGPKELQHYQSLNGRKPFLDWFLGLRDRKTRSVLLNRLERFAAGNPGHWRSVGQGVFELKVHYGPGYRIYFGCDGPRVVLLLIGGDKGTQARNIHEAQIYWQDYCRRKHGAER